MKKRTVKDLQNIKGKRVFLTADFNISYKKEIISTNTRILEVIPTIRYLLNKKCKIIIASHLDRPNGIDPKLSLKPVALQLRQLSGLKVNLIDNFWQKEALKKIARISSSELILLENIRFCPGETKNDPDFSQHLSKMADFYVNDAFGASHRVHSSIVGITQYLPAVSGLLMAKEINTLDHALKNPSKPLLVIIGGAKTPEKISVIDKLLDIADTICLGGAIANTFLASWGFGMGLSLVDYEMIEMSRLVFWKAAKKHCALILPQDVVIYDKNANHSPKVVDYNQVPNHVAIYDIGPKTNIYYSKLIKSAKTIIWNGPMGRFEQKQFSMGTDNVLKSIAQSHALSVVGGGDTLDSLKNQKYLKKISHLSTGGSAMLQYLKDGSLPGIDVLQNN